MFTVGLDVHQSRSSLCVLDARGKTLRQTEVKGCLDAVVGEIAALRNTLPGPLQVCFEASTGYGVLHDRLAPLAAKVAPGLGKSTTPASERADGVIFGQSRRTNDAKTSFAG